MILQEALNIIAVKHGYPAWGVACFRSSDEKINEMRTEAMELYTSQSNSHKHSVMQAEASDGAEGATVGNSAAGKGVRKRLRKCEKLGYKRCSMEGSFGCCVG
jgi:hypothetical protein